MSTETYIDPDQTGTSISQQVWAQVPASDADQVIKETKRFLDKNLVKLLPGEPHIEVWDRGGDNAPDGDTIIVVNFSFVTPEKYLKHDRDGRYTESELNYKIDVVFDRLSNRLDLVTYQRFHNLGGGVYPTYQ